VSNPAPDPLLAPVMTAVRPASDLNIESSFHQYRGLLRHVRRASWGLRQSVETRGQSFLTANHVTLKKRIEMWGAPEERGGGTGAMDAAIILHYSLRS